MYDGKPVYIVDGSRTPFLKAGAPGPFAAADLALQAGRPLLARQSFNPDDLDEVILGCVGLNQMKPILEELFLFGWAVENLLPLGLLRETVQVVCRH